MKKLVVVAMMIAAFLTPIKAQEMIEIYNDVHANFIKVNGQCALVVGFLSDRPVFFKPGGAAIIATEDGKMHTFAYMLGGKIQYMEELGKYVVLSPLIFGDFNFIKTEKLKHLFIDTTKESPYYTPFSESGNRNIKTLYNQVNE